MLQVGWKAGPEQAGFDLVETSDHFHPWSDDGQACFTWTWLGAVLARTSRIGLGTGVTCPIFRYHPVLWRRWQPRSVRWSLAAHSSRSAQAKR